MATSSSRLKRPDARGLNFERFGETALARFRTCLVFVF